MKHLNSILVAALFILGVGVANAQDENNPWAIEVGVNAVDLSLLVLRDGRFLLEEMQLKENFLTNISTQMITGTFYLLYLNYL